MNQAKYLGPSFGGERGQREGEAKVGQRGRGGEEECKPKNNNSFPPFSSLSLCVRGNRMETSNLCSQRRSAGCGNFVGKAFLGKSGKTVMWF